MSSSTTAVASGDVPQGPIVTHGGDKSSGDGDEELPGMQLATAMSPGSPGDGGGTSAMDLEPEIIDPAILALSVEGRTHRPYQYTKERLMELRDAPLSRKRPDYLDPQHNNSQGLWDPERWHHDWKRSSPDPSAQDSSNHNKRRSGDPRERLRKEQDGIVLSPQRRSFNSGCFVPVNQPRRPESPLGSGKASEHLGAHREISAGARRIGSGRIIARDVSWDYRPDKGELDGPEFGFGRAAGGNNRERKDTERDTGREERYERRSFGRDFDRERERDKDRHISRNGRYNDRRRISSDSKDDEPEWFSGGPTSQADTIELRGFEDALCDSERAPNGRKKQSPAKKKRNKERAITKSNESVTSNKEDSPKGPGARSTPTPQDTHPSGPIPHSPIQEEVQQPLTTSIAAVQGSGSEQDDKSDAPTDMSTTSVPEHGGSSGSNSSGQKIQPQPMDFNLEDFLKMDSIPELLTNGVGNDIGTSAGSRFSRWFNKETSPVRQEENSRRSSLQDEHLVNNIINGLGDSDTYFAPISPAAATTGGNAVGGPPPGPQAASKPVTLLEILQRGKQNLAKQPHAADIPPVLKNIGERNVPGKVLSLEELEARMRQGSDRSQEIPSGSTPGANLTRPKQDEDMSAFKRLLAQVSGGQAIPASNGPLPHKPLPTSLSSTHPTSISNPLNSLQPSLQQQPMSLLQMLSKSQQEDARAAQVQHSLLSPGGPGGPAGLGGTAGGPHVPNDLVLKLHQVQQHQQRQQQQAEMLSKLMNSGGRGQQFGMGHADLSQSLGGPGRELLQRPEALAILQGLKRGDITPQHLIQQLAANPAMQPRHRELLMTILKQSPNVGPSPRVLSPIPPPQHMLFQQQQQQQLRVSPLPPAAYCVSPILATSPNTLTVHHPVIQQRIPSPRELQAHTQGIMQRALIKKKLEEQQENFRKKQEMQQRAQSPAVNNNNSNNSTSSSVSSGVQSGINTSGQSGVQSQPSGGNVPAGGAARASPAKHMSSPTPLAFTPTSVLRKMTAEKDETLPQKDTKSSNENHPKPQQGRAVTGMRQNQPQPPLQPLQPQNWNLQQPVKPPVGRPIVKGNNNYQFVTQDYQQLHMQRFQQQQRAKLAASQGQQQQQQQQQFNLQQSRAMPLRNQLQNLQMQQQRGGNSWHQLVVGQSFDTRGMPVTGRGLQLGRGSPGDGDLSPTSDQLARWFSPELLAQARAGKLPDMPPASIAQNALSLEELERIQQNTAPVHN